MAAPQRWAGFELDRPLVMGILNVTPDSFSDAGRCDDADRAIVAGLLMAADGADIVDIGGETTQPGARPTPPAVEQARIIPVIRALSACGVVVSADTRHAETMRLALAAGARIVNDVSGLLHDPASAAVVAEAGCPVVLMHMRGTPATMMAYANYRDVAAEVAAELGTRIKAARRAGIAPERIALDPGLGFAKQPGHSRAILGNLSVLKELGYPLLIGASRKGFVGALSGEARPDRRLGGSLAAGLFALMQGAAILRVHDVRETVQAIRVWHGLFISGNIVGFGMGSDKRSGMRR